MKKFKFRKSIKKKERKQLNWSEQQQILFKDSSEGSGNRIVQAAPGSGKTTSIAECMYNLPIHYIQNREVLGITFSKDMSLALDATVPQGVHIKTFHKLGLETIRNNWGYVYGLDNNCVDSKGLIADMLAEAEVGDSEKGVRLRKNLALTMDLAKTKLAMSPAEIDMLTVDHGIDTCGLGSNFSEHVFNMMEKTKKAPQVINGKSHVSFADMIWLPYVYGWQPKQYPIIFVDEGQDISLARLYLVMRALAPNGRMFVYADKMQAIFQFAGASPGIVDKMARDLEAKSLMLSVSYRLPRSVAVLARKYNPTIQTAPNAIDGEVVSISEDDIINNCKPNTAIISRTNYPLVDLVFKLLKQGIKANIQGKDVGNRFLWRISCWQPKDLKDLVDSIYSWRDMVCGLLEERKRPTDRIIDEADCLLKLTEGAGSVNDVTKRIKTFFSDDPRTQVKLTTCHKAKGLEWNNVILLDKTFKPEKNEEEQCIHYVALTRAKERLALAS